MPVEIVAQIEQQLTRGQGLLGCRGGAIRGASATFRATEHVQHLLPRELIDVRGAEAGIIFEVLFRELPLGLEFREKDVRNCGDDVEVFRGRQEIQKNENDEVVHPPGYVTRLVGEARAQDFLQADTYQG